MLWKLFKSTFIISAITFGGGYIIVLMMQKKFVEEYRWIDQEEMLDLIAIAQTTPGAVAINTSIALGYRMSGLLGAIVATIATALPPMCLLIVSFYIYDWLKGNELMSVLLQGMQAGVCAIICDVVVNLCVGLKKQKSLSSWMIFTISLFINLLFKWHILIIIFVMTIASVIAILIEERWQKHGTR